MLCHESVRPHVGVRVRIRMYYATSIRTTQRHSLLLQPVSTVSTVLRLRSCLSTRRASTGVRVCARIQRSTELSLHCLLGLCGSLHLCLLPKLFCIYSPPLLPTRTHALSIFRSHHTIPHSSASSLSSCSSSALFSSLVLSLLPSWPKVRLHHHHAPLNL